MKSLSLQEFHDYFKTNKAKCYIFDSDNQDDKNITQFNFVATYTQLDIFLQPGSINFKNNLSKISFTNVKHINIEDDIPVPGIVFHIVCEDRTHRGSEISYTFLAD